MEHEKIDFETVYPDLYSIYLFTKGDRKAMEHHLKQKYQLDEASRVHFVYEAVKRIEEKPITRKGSNWFGKIISRDD